MMMKRNPLPRDADQLLAVGEAVAAVLAENQGQWDVPTEVEALLRASIAAAAFAIDAYVAVLAGSHKSPVAMSHLAEAKSRCDRSIQEGVKPLFDPVFFRLVTQALKENHPGCVSFGGCAKSF